MNLRRVELTVYTDNAPALALYRKFGFETEGEMRDYAVRDGRFVDVYSMARLRRSRGGWGSEDGREAASGQQRPVCPANESVPNLLLGSSSIAGCARDPLSGST